MDRKHESILNLAQNFPHNSKPTSMYFHAPLMYMWCKQAMARNILEIGIASGYSSYWLGQAAKEAGGKYFGVEIHQGRAAAIGKGMEQLGIPYDIWAMDSKTMTEEFVKEKMESLDFCFLDGDHSPEAVLHEVEILYPYLVGKGRGYFFIHDIYSASRDAWAEIKREQKYQFEIIGIMNNFGMGILRKIGV